MLCIVEFSTSSDNFLEVVLITTSFFLETNRHLDALVMLCLNANVMGLLDLA